MLLVVAAIAAAVDRFGHIQAIGFVLGRVSTTTDDVGVLCAGRRTSRQADNVPSPDDGSYFFISIVDIQPIYRSRVPATDRDVSVGFKSSYSWSRLGR